MGSKELNEEQFKKRGELLDKAIVNRENPHPLDLRRAAVLIFSLIQKGYYFGGEELEGAMQESGGGFSETMGKSLDAIREVCSTFDNGLNDPTVEQFKLKDFE